MIENKKMKDGMEESEGLDYRMCLPPDPAIDDNSRGTHDKNI